MQGFHSKHCSATDIIRGAFIAVFILLFLPLHPALAGPLDTLQPGYWYEIPNSKLTSSGVYPPSPVPPGATGPTSLMSAWNGGAFDTTRNRLIVHGGGHGDYAGNELYAFDLSTLTWSRPWGPSPNSTIYASGGGGQETYSDGNPSSVHTYSGLLYLPSQDKLWRGGGSLWSGSGQGSRASWYFDFNSLTWQRRADSTNLGVSQVAAYDSVTGRVFGFSDRYQMMEYTPASNTWASKVSLSGLSIGEEMTGVIDPVARVFVIIGNGHVIVYDLSAGTIRNQSTSGGSTVVSARGPGLTYDSTLQKIVGWAGGTSLYSLNTSNWTWTQHSPASGNTVSPSAKANVGVFTRFQYVPSKNLHIVVNSVDTSVYAFKLSAGSSTPPPSDTTAPSVSVSSPSNGSTVSGSAALAATASDNVGVVGVQFKLNGANLGSEDASAPFSVSWDTTSVTNGAHSLTAVARDAAGNLATATALTVTVSNSTSTPPSTGGTWTNKGTPALGSGPYSGSGGKHSRLAFDSTRGRIVHTGGDYSEPNDSQSGDGNARIWSTSTANYSGSWTALHPFCSGSGQLMPGRPDNVGFVYDSTRDKFYTFPGFYFSTQSTTGCEGGGSVVTNSATQFNPTTGLYSAVPWPSPTGGYGGDLGSTYAVYDPTGDRVYRFRDTGSIKMEFLNVATNTWGSTSAPSYTDIPSTNVHSDQSVIDVQGRAVYCYLRTPSSSTGYLLKYDITSNTFSRIAVPSSVSAHLATTGQTDIETWMAFDPTNRVILIPASDAQYSGTVQILGIYNVDSGAWTTSTPPSGIYCNVVGFDATNGVMVVMGRTTGNGGGSAPIYFYKHGTGTAPPPPPVDTTAPTVSIATPSNGATLAGSVSLTAAASDNVGVIGVQFKLDGANLSAEDTSAPYSISWNTTTSGNGSHVLTAVARDAAGNLKTSSSVTVTVSNSSSGATTLVTPADNWCSIVNSATAGTEVVFAPGNYSTPCWFTARGSSSAPVVARSQNLLQPAVFNYAGSGSNVLELHDASYFTIRGFSFATTQDGVDAIRIWRGDNIVIEQNSFQGIGGVSISANTYDSPNITVRKNTFRDLKYTGLYFGCQEGDCKAANVLIEQNLFDGVTTPYDASAIGYAVQIKLNSSATIRDNTIYRTKGPGIMVYGSNQGDPASVIEGNYVEGSVTDGGIVIGGGPAIVRNNIVVGNAYGGISAQNYNGRNLQQNIWIVNNTVLNNDDSGINVSGWSSGSGNVMAFNAISPRAGFPALSPSAPVGTITGNITCASPAACFINGSSAPYDLWPSSSSPLLNAAGSGSEAWRPTDDFMGIARGAGSDVGAFETPSSATNHLVGGTSARPNRVSGTTVSSCDCNSDGSTNALDLQVLVNAILAGNSASTYDINHNGAVNALDLQVLGNVVLGVAVCP